MTEDPKPTTLRLYDWAYKRLQIAVLERDSFTCQKCGQHTTAPPHHKRKRSRGGSDTMENMITLCGPLEIDCHAKEHR